MTASIRPHSPARAAWPAATDARFADLLAQGGFAVSAEQIGGVIGNVKIRSTVGGTVKLLNPWPQQNLVVTEEETHAAIPVTLAGTIHSFPTSAGKTYLLRALP